MRTVKVKHDFANNTIETKRLPNICAYPFIISNKHSDIQEIPNTNIQREKKTPTNLTDHFAYPISPQTNDAHPSIIDVFILMPPTIENYMYISIFIYP